IKLQTPQATIGIRGTVLEITVIHGETVVNVIQGAAIVCLRRQPSNCTQVIGAGGSISATAGDLEVTRTASQRPQPYDPGARESSGGPSGGDPPAGSADTGQTGGGQPPAGGDGDSAPGGPSGGTTGGTVGRD
ncbi:MAG: hypothetical protein ACRCYS_19210, partial [Beijerinckiaceae bacterium]